jgi:VWFA-related protein
MKEHRVRWLLACVVFLTTTVRLPAQSPSAPITQQPEASVPQAPEMKIRARVLLVNTFATVVNGKGQLVANLDEKDFQVTDNGVLQKIAYFDLGRTPLSLVFLIETSSRIEPLLSAMRQTGIIFGDTVMGPDDEAAVVGFNDSVDNLADFTTDHKVIQDTINKLKVGTERSKLFDAMAVGVEMLSSRVEMQPMVDLRERRLVIVIMSEATDFGSETRLDTVLRRAQLSNITIYSVGIPTTLAELEAPPKDVRPHLSPEGTFLLPRMPGIVQIPSTEDTRNGYGNLMNLNVWAVRNVKDKITGHALQIAASGTGGHHIATFGGTSMQKAVDEIGGELHLQYSLGYELKGTKETGYHEIRVHVDRKDLKVRARPGYYIAPPEI